MSFAGIRLVFDIFPLVVIVIESVHRRDRHVSHAIRTDLGLAHLAVAGELELGGLDLVGQQLAAALTHADNGIESVLDQNLMRAVLLESLLHEVVEHLRLDTSHEDGLHSLFVILL